jgi:hypothetical protein
MKNFLLVLSFMFGFSALSNAQETIVAATTFTKAQQAEIKKVLGSDFVPVFSSKGELAIATTASVSKVKALAGGGFQKGVNGNAANNILIHSGWVLATSDEIMQAMKSKLGKQRFAQLEAIVGKR